MNTKEARRLYEGLTGEERFRAAAPAGLGLRPPLGVLPQVASAGRGAARARPAPDRLGARDIFGETRHGGRLRTSPTKALSALPLRLRGCDIFGETRHGGPGHVGIVQPGLRHCWRNPSPGPVRGRLGSSCHAIARLRRRCDVSDKDAGTRTVGRVGRPRLASAPPGTLELPTGDSVPRRPPGREREEGAETFSVRPKVVLVDRANNRGTEARPSSVTRLLASRGAYPRRGPSGPRGPRGPTRTDTRDARLDRSRREGRADRL